MPQIVNGVRSGSLAGLRDFFFPRFGSGRGYEARLPGSNLISNVTDGLPCKWPPSVVHYKSPALVGRTVSSVLSGAVGGNTGPISDLGQIPGQSQGSTDASIARETIFVIVAGAC